MPMPVTGNSQGGPPVEKMRTLRRSRREERLLVDTVSEREGGGFKGAQRFRPANRRREEGGWRMLAKAEVFPWMV